MKREAKKIGNLLESVLKSINAYDNFIKLTIVENWNELVDPGISRVCKAVAFEDNVLIVQAISEAWKKELRQHKKKIISALQQAFNQIKIEDVKIV